MRTVLFALLTASVAGCGGRVVGESSSADGGTGVSDATALECRPYDVRGVGICEALAGYAWNGASCISINCRCEGSDCDRLHATIGMCESATRSCVKR